MWAKHEKNSTCLCPPEGHRLYRDTKLTQQHKETGTRAKLWERQGNTLGKLYGGGLCAGP